MKGSWLPKRIIVGMLIGLVTGALISELTFMFLKNGETRAPQSIELIIPAGTAARVNAGEQVPSIPASMSFVLGDTLVVRNNDSEAHQLGPLYIPPGSSASLRLDTEQKYVANCTFQPGRYFGLDVQPPLTTETRLAGILQAGLPLGLLFILYGVFAMPAAKKAVR